MPLSRSTAGCRAARHLAAATIATLLALATASARADEPRAARLAWRHRKPHIVDYAAALVLSSLAVGELMLPSGQNDAHRRGGIVFDDAVRDRWALPTSGDRATASRISDVLLVTSMTYPVVDVGVAWLALDSSDVAWPMGIIDSQSLAFSSLVTGVVKRTVDRERPVATACRENPSYDPSCRSSALHYSFPSGHTSMAFTGASLACLHHTQLPLYGGGADVVACVTALTMATMTGALRIAADKHYATDVLAGGTLGVLSGAVLPWLSFYRVRVGGETRSLRLSPWMGDGAAGLTLGVGG